MQPDFPTSSETLIDGSSERFSLARKSVLLLIFCFAQFLEAFNNAALFPAIPAIERSLGITQSQTVWIISAFQVTFASFLLISGRISDVYNPKMVFIAGLSCLGVISLYAGFVHNEIAIIVLRAIMGIASAMTIPSALTLLVRVFSEPLEQARAMGVFGGCGAFADILGLFIGATLVQYISYRWIFWFATIFSIPLALGCLFIIPSEVAKPKCDLGVHDGKWKMLDLTGISILTVALILLIYALTSGSIIGWATAGVIIPLIISALLIIGFFHWETRLPFEYAAIPPRTWFYRNFSALFFSALLPFFWWNALFIVFTKLWQNVFHWTAVSTALHMLPLGVAASTMGLTGPLSRVLSSKWIILTGLSMAAVATALLAIGGGMPEDYWPFVFPAFTLGSAGIMLTYTHTNIAIFQSAPASAAGTVGAIFNGALQFGSAVGLAAFSSIETSVEATSGGTREYKGHAAAFWFLLAVVLAEILSVCCFVRRDTEREPRSKTDDDENNQVVAVSGKELPR